jgi:hypothetical protein
MPASVTSTGARREEARLNAEVKLGFYVHLAIYSGVNVMLFVIWWCAGGFPHMNVTERIAEKEYQRLKEQQQ